MFPRESREERCVEFRSDGGKKVASSAIENRALAAGKEH